MSSLSDTPSSSVLASKAASLQPIFAIVAGEASGDLLGAGLMKGIKASCPNAQFVGIGGQAMIEQGLESYYPMDRLAVMGLIPILKRYPELAKVRRQLIQRWCQNPPVAFIGIDAPEFNTGLELKLKAVGIPTVHYVSPSVWAWRQGRLKTIERAVDLMLTLFPFEAEFYKQNAIAVEFVGHPFANAIAEEINPVEYKSQFGYAATDEVLAVLPGSRGSEIKYTAAVYLQVMQALLQCKPQLKFLVPMINSQRAEQFNLIKQQIAPELEVQVVIGQSRDALAAADVVLLTSGTATLEAMLLKKPMVVAYKWSALSHALISPFVKTEFVALPNLLAQDLLPEKKGLVPEFIQQDCTVDNLVEALRDQFDSTKAAELKQSFQTIHIALRQDADSRAAAAVLDLCKNSLPKS